MLWTPVDRQAYRNVVRAEHAEHMLIQRATQGFVEYLPSGAFVF